MIHVVFECISGWHQDRHKLNHAIKLAKQRGAIVVAESADRFLRAHDYNTEKRPNAQPTVWEYERLVEAADGVSLVSILHPDRDWKRVRAHQTRRSLNRPVPSGKKRMLRDELLGEVIALRAAGKSYGEIVRATGVHRTNVRRWIAYHAARQP